MLMCIELIGSLKVLYCITYGVACCFWKLHPGNLFSQLEGVVGHIIPRYKYTVNHHALYRLDLRSIWFFKISTFLCNYSSLYTLYCHKVGYSRSI